MADLLIAIKEKLNDPSYGVHCFCQKWQHLQLEHLKVNRRVDETLLEQDFAEAYTMSINFSAQSTYWSDQTVEINWKCSGEDC